MTIRTSRSQRIRAVAVLSATAAIGAFPALARSADDRACPTAREALDRAYVAADAVEDGSGDIVMNLMPASLAAEQAAGAALLAAWPDSAVDVFAEIAKETRALSADPAARTPAAAQTLRDQARSGEAEIGTICAI